MALHFERTFSSHGDSLLAMGGKWENRTALVEDQKGNIIFKQDNVHFPESWSQQATNIVSSKYFYGQQHKFGRENSVSQLVDRVVKWITEEGIARGYFQSHNDAYIFRDELAWLCLNQYGAFNSPVWFNVGVNPNKDGYGINFDGMVKPVSELNRPRYQCSACFIVSVEDSIPSISRRAVTEMAIFKDGSGSGSDNSRIRSRRERVTGGGFASGPVSFMEVYDAVAKTTKSGGKSRRAAKLESMKISHPDILDFIRVKGLEEKKAKALIAQGYEANFNGEAYSSVKFQNSNLSVRVTDEFMSKIDGEDEDDTWPTIAVLTGQHESYCPTYSASELMEEIADAAWHCGDPGLQYEDTIQHWHTCPNTAPINSSNPCSEYMFIDDSACNLASLNLIKFRRSDGSFDSFRFRQAARIFLIAQEILVDSSSYPTPEIAANSHKFRPLGLGYANLGGLLMSMGLPYDSPAGRSMAGAVTSLLGGQAYLTSVELAQNLGPFEGFAINREPMLGVMVQHHEAALDGLSHQEFSHADFTMIFKLWKESKLLWERVVQEGDTYGFRNSQVTVLAPTGTIAFMMDCDTSGIEPDIALVKYKNLAGGGQMKIVNQIVPVALKSLGYDDQSTVSILAHIARTDTIEGAVDLRPEDLPVFDCAFKPAHGTRAIAWTGHLSMMAAVQPFLSGAISKTINMPSESTVGDIVEAYIEGWNSGLKAVAIYRDGSKDSQPVGTTEEGSRDGSRRVAEDLGHAPTAWGDMPIAHDPDARGTRVGVPLVAPDREPAPADGVPDRNLTNHAPGDGVRVEAPRRERLPDTRQAVTHKFSVGGHEGYLTIGKFPDGRPGEVFITVAKEGSTVGGLMDTIGVLLSMGLQYGVPLQALVDKLSNQKFEPNGHTHNRDIPISSSLIDYVVRWLGMEFIPGYRQSHAPDRGDIVTTMESIPEHHRNSGPLSGVLAKDLPLILPGEEIGESGLTFENGKIRRMTHVELAISDLQYGMPALAAAPPLAGWLDGPSCDNCGTIMTPAGRCYKCSNCGSTNGCS